MPSNQRGKVSATFSRTTRSLKAHRSGRWAIVVVIALSILAIWGLWFLSASVTIYKTTLEARLEARPAVHPISAEIGGRVVELNISVGQEVEEGDVLFVLNSEAERLALNGANAQLAGIQPRIDAIDAQIEAAVAAIEAQHSATDAAVDEADAWTEEADTRADYAEEEEETLDSLADRGVATGAELREARAEAAATEAEVRARREVSDRVEAEGLVEIQDRLAAVAALEARLVDLQGQELELQATIVQLQHQINRRTVVAPISGRIGELHQLTVGTVITPGQSYGSLIPPGDLLVVAFFPSTEISRLSPGQNASLRFYDYSWTQYGTVPAIVATISEEPIDGRSRVELELEDDQTTLIPLAHGLQAAVEVEVEELTPFELVLRTAGKWLNAEN